MRRTIFSLLVMAAAAPTGLSAQSAGATADVTARAAATVEQPAAGATDAAAQARIRAAIEGAAEAGVPRSLLENKVAEGRAKGVAAARIAAAVEQRAEVLSRVSTGMASSVSAISASELTAAADAHEAGVSIESLVELCAGAGSNRAAALTVLADLVIGGRTAPAHALHRVDAALSAGADALVSLGSTAGAARGLSGGATGSAAITGVITGG